MLRKAGSASGPAVTILLLCSHAVVCTPARPECQASLLPSEHIGMLTSNRAHTALLSRLSFVLLQCDQAALTGESLPVKKFSGDVAFSGESE